MSLTRLLVLTFAFGFATSACKKDSKPDDTTTTKTSDGKTKPDDTKTKPKPADDKTKPDDTTSKTKPDDTKQPPQPKPGQVAAYDAVFDSTCSTDADCMLVSASRCSHCGCTDMPINVKEKQHFLDVVSEYKCPPPDPAELEISCGGCPGFAPVCTDGMCKADMR